MFGSNSFCALCLTLGLLGCEAVSTPAQPVPPAVSTPGTKAVEAVTSESLLSEVVQGPSYRVAAQPIPNKVEYQRVFSVPDGPQGLWTNRNPASDAPNGPQGCAVDDDGSFWFIDSGDGFVGMTTRFVHYSEKGKRLGVFPTAEHQLESLLAMGGHIYARDLLRTSIVRFSREGKLEQELAYGGVGSFARLGDQVAAMRSFYPTPILKADKNLTPGAQLREFEHRGVRYRLAKDAIEIGRLRTTIEGTDAVQFGGLLGLSTEGELLVLMYNESGPDPILRFDATGKLTHQTWLPKESVIVVPYPLCMDGQGNVFATITREKRIDLVKLTFVPVML